MSGKGTQRRYGLVCPRGLTQACVYEEQEGVNTKTEAL